MRNENRKQETRVRVLSAVLERVSAPLSKADLDLVAREFANRLPQEYRTILSQRHSTTPINAKQQKSQPAESGAALKNLDEAGYNRLLIELSLLDAAYSSYSRDGAERLEAVAKRYRVNVLKIAESIAAEFAARRKKRDERRKARGNRKLSSEAAVKRNRFGPLSSDGGPFFHSRIASRPLNKTLDSNILRGYDRFHTRIRNTNISQFRRRIQRTKGEHCSMRYAIRVPAHLHAVLFWKKPSGRRAPVRLAAALSALVALVVATPLHAQQDPWDQAVQVLQTAFTGSIAKGLSLVAIVVGGLMFAFGEGQSKKALAGIIFGVGMAIGAVNFMAWLFPS